MLQPYIESAVALYDNATINAFQYCEVISVNLWEFSFQY